MRRVRRERQRTYGSAVVPVVPAGSRHALALKGPTHRFVPSGPGNAAQLLPPSSVRFPATVAGMSDDDEWTPGDVTSMIANPFYAINIDEGLAVPHEPLISEDDWVKPTFA